MNKARIIKILKAASRQPAAWAVLKVLLVVLAVLIACRITEGKTERRMVAEFEAIRAEERAQAEAAQLAAQQEAVERDPLKPEAEAIARVLYGTAQHYSEEAWRGVIWCILNRVDSGLYPNTVQDVCSQDKQWMGYSDANPVIQDMYDAAYRELSQWHNGGYRPMSAEYVYLSWDGNQMILRDSYVENARTHYWRAG